MYVETQNGVVNDDVCVCVCVWVEVSGDPDPMCGSQFALLLFQPSPLQLLLNSKSGFTKEDVAIVMNQHDKVGDQ